MLKFKRKFYVFIISLFLIIIQTGCSDNDNDDFVSNNNELTGYFLDTIVEGLNYKCGSLKGQTASDGSFKYVEGKTIEFFVGDITLGSGFAKKVMTPVDIVDGAANENNDQVVRICQFLLSCDAYNDGVISITDDIHNKAKNKTIDFSQSINNDVVQELFGQNNIVSSNEAKSHFAKTFKGKDILLAPMILSLNKKDGEEKEVNVISETDFKDWTFSWDINNCPQNACACVGHDELDEKEFQVYVNSTSNSTNCAITLNITLEDDTNIEKILPVTVLNTDGEQTLNFAISDIEDVSGISSDEQFVYISGNEYTAMPANLFIYNKNDGSFNSKTSVPVQVIGNFDSQDDSFWFIDYEAGFNRYYIFKISKESTYIEQTIIFPVSTTNIKGLCWHEGFLYSACVVYDSVEGDFKDKIISINPDTGELSNTIYQLNKENYFMVDIESHNGTLWYVALKNGESEKGLLVNISIDGLELSSEDLFTPGHSIKYIEFIDNTLWYISNIDPWSDSTGIFKYQLTLQRKLLSKGITLNSLNY